MNKGLQFLSIDITHKCNLYCDFCAKLVQGSKWEVSMREVELFCKHMQNSKAECLRMSGGEATIHKRFRDIVKTIAAAFPDKKLELGTNGINLCKYEDLIPYFWKITITPYPGKNDDAVEKFRSYPNVNTRVHDEVDWFDPFANPNLTREKGLIAYNACMTCMVNVVGDRVYGCCQAEVMERSYVIGSVHVKLDKNWMENYQLLDMTAACQHCSWAAHEKSIQEAIRNG